MVAPSLVLLGLTVKSYSHVCTFKVVQAGAAFACLQLLFQAAS